MPSAYKVQNPEELGIIPLIAAAAPAVLGGAGKAVGGIAKGIGSLFKKKKKKGPAPAAPAPTGKTSPPSKHEAPSKGKKHKTAPVTEHAAAALAAIPTDVKADTLAALKHFSSQKDAGKHAHRELVKKLAAVVKPQIDKMSADVTTAALQRKVTSEHNKLVKEDDRWKSNQTNQEAILKKMDELQAALERSNTRNTRAYKIYGVNLT